MRIGTAVIIVWLIIGAIAAGQRHYYNNSSTESDPREPDAPPEDSANAVQVMTVRSAKGLEFPIVFVAALHKGVETNPPVVTFSPRIGLGARWRNPAVRKDKDDLFQHEIRRERTERENSKESHRLLYVAMTRAEQHLVLSFSGEAAAQGMGQVGGGASCNCPWTHAATNC